MPRARARRLSAACPLTRPSRFLRGLAGINLVGMDLVEVAPDYDVGEITSLAGASLALEMLYLYASK